VIRRQVNRDGSMAITEFVTFRKASKPTYQQDWRAYNAAQIPASLIAAAGSTGSLRLVMGSANPLNPPRTLNCRESCPFKMSTINPVKQDLNPPLPNGEGSSRLTLQ
jgi:hypothetical protein